MWKYDVIVIGGGHAGCEAALVASLTMPSINPSAVEVAVGAAALAAVDADGPAYIMQTHSARRDALLSAVDAAGETELLVYDTQKRLWHRQDNTAAVAFAAAST